MSKTHPILTQAAAAAPVGPVPMADPDAYALAAAERWQTVGWRCACGATPNPSDGAWRWTGTAWEHNHGGQAGHFRANYTPPLESGFDDPTSGHPALHRIIQRIEPHPELEEAPKQRYEIYEIDLPGSRQVAVGIGEISEDIMLRFRSPISNDDQAEFIFALRRDAARALLSLLQTLLRPEEV